MPTVVLVGCLDTKGEEYAFVRDRLLHEGVDVLTVDTGTQAPAAYAPDVTRVEVAAAAGADLDDLVESRTAADAVATMAEGAAATVSRLHAQGCVDGALALGGTGGASIGARAFGGLPVGVPKAIVSTAVATSHAPAYVGESDLVLFPAVTDVAGVNRISGPIMANAAAALAGMVKSAAPRLDDSRQCIAASMFGVTTPGVTAARSCLEEMGYEVVVFHMTGVGGRTLERLVREGYFAATLDVTTHELADELAGGVFAADADRLSAAAAVEIPQVVSVGALDMVNFHTPDTVPERYRDRNPLVHNPAVTVVRTSPDEAAELGVRLATRLSATTAPAALFLPLRGMSAYGVEGAPLHHPRSDAALFDAVRTHLDHNRVELHEIDTHVNDPEFAAAMAETLDEFLS